MTRRTKIVKMKAAEALHIARMSGVQQMLRAMGYPPVEVPYPGHDVEAWWHSGEIRVGLMLGVCAALSVNQGLMLNAMRETALALPDPRWSKLDREAFRKMMAVERVSVDELPARVVDIGLARVGLLSGVTPTDSATQFRQAYDHFRLQAAEHLLGGVIHLHCSCGDDHTAQMFSSITGVSQAVCCAYSALKGEELGLEASAGGVTEAVQHHVAAWSTEQFRKWLPFDVVFAKATWSKGASA